jgi:ABC-2 type transport system permease protein
VLAFGLAMFPPLLAALAMSREGELKTILQVYVSSITAFEYLAGKVIAYTIVAWSEWISGMVVLYLIFGLQLTGDPTPLLVTTFFYLLCTTCFGVMLGAAIPNQAAAIQAAQLGGFLTSFLLAGFIFPVQNMPLLLRFLSYFVPMRYYLEVIRDAFPARRRLVWFVAGAAGARLFGNVFLLACLDVDERYAGKCLIFGL